MNRPSPLRVLGVFLSLLVCASPAGAASPGFDGFRIPLSDLDREILVFDRDIKLKVKKKKDRVVKPSEIRFSLDGKKLLFICLPYTFRVWDLDKHIEIPSPQLNDPQFDDSPKRKYGWYRYLTRDMKTLGYHNSKNKDVYLQPVGGKAVRVYKGKSVKKYSHKAFMKFSPDSKLLLISQGGSYPTKSVITLIDVATKKKITQFRGSHGKIEHVAFHPDGRRAVFSLIHTDKSLQVWDLYTGTMERKLDKTSAGHLGLSPDGGWLVGLADRRDGRYWIEDLRKYDVNTGKLLWELKLVSSAHLRPDGEVLAIESKKRFGENTALIDSATGRELQILPISREKTSWARAFSPDGRILAVQVSPQVTKLYKYSAIQDQFRALAKEEAGLDRKIAEKSALEDRYYDGAVEEYREALKVLKKEQAPNYAPKGEFETTGDYKKRVAEADRVIAKLKEDHELDSYAAMKAEALAEIPGKFHAKAADLKFAYTVPARLRRYNADKGAYSVRVLGRTFILSVLPEEAKDLKNRAPKLEVAGTLSYLDGRYASLTLDEFILDREIGRRYAIKSAAGFRASAKKRPTAPVVNVKAPPNLKIGSIEFVDASRDKILQAGESAEIRVSVRNAGSGKAYGVELIWDAGWDNPGVEKMSASAPIKTLKPGRTTVLKLKMRGGRRLATAKARLKLTVTEANGFDSAPKVIAFRTRKFLPPRLKVVKVGILSSDGGRTLEKGQIFTVTLAVQNTGAGPAMEVRASVKTGNKYVKVFTDAVVPLGDLRPGERLEASFDLIVTRRYNGSSRLPVTFRIGEKRKRFSMTPSVPLEIGREAPEVEVVTVAARERGSAVSTFEDIERPPVLKASEKPFGPKDYAVVIGIEKYQNVPRSQYSYDDAKLMRRYLKALGMPNRNIRLLQNDRATRSSFVKTLERWLKNRVNKDSRVFVYYSGHGSPDPAKGKAYLVPYDGDPTYLAETAYPVSRLYSELGALPAKEVFVVLDACFSGAGGRSVLAKGARPMVLKVRTGVLPPNMALLTATGNDQISTSSDEKKHGVFTYHFLRAIKMGGKDIGEVYTELRPAVENEAQELNVEQTPQLLPALRKIRGRFKLRK